MPNTGWTDLPLEKVEVVGPVEVVVPEPLEVTVDNFPSVQPVSGTVTVVQPTGTNLHAVVDSGSIAVSNFPSVQPVSGTVTVQQPTGSNLHTVVDSGSIAVSNFPATQPVSGTVTANQGGTWNINNVSGTVSLPTGASTEATLSSLNNKFTSSTSTITRVASSATSVSVLASNANRRLASFFNDSIYDCYLKLGSTAASTASFTVRISPGGFLIVNNDPIYTGAFTALWASVDGGLQVTELT